MWTDVDFSRVPEKAPKCLDCRKRAVLRDSSSCYPDEPELHGRPMWRCECGNFASCRTGTLVPRYLPSCKGVRLARKLAYDAIANTKARMMADEGLSQWQARKKLSRIAKANNVSLDLSSCREPRIAATWHFFEGLKPDE